MKTEFQGKKIGRFYILDENKEVVLCEQFEQHVFWFEENNACIACDTAGDAMVSTVFIGQDMGDSASNPLVFETRLFINGEDQNELVQFYESWDEAHAGHNAMVKKHLATH